MDETGDRLIREGVIPPMIIVGMDNTGRDRIREYMPHRSLHPMMLRVQGSRYPSFSDQGSHAVHGAQLPRGRRAGEYRARRIVAGRADCALHRGRASGSDWPVTAGESVAVGVEPAE